jgi:hypothetical protein
MYDPSQGGSLARQPQIQQRTQGSEIPADGSQFTQNTSPAFTASTMAPGRLTTQSRPFLTNKEEQANFIVKKARAREAARERAASRLTKHSLTSPSTGASSGQQETFTALEIQGFKRNTAGLMGALKARNQRDDKDKTTRAMWEALRKKVQHDEIYGAECERCGDQSTDEFGGAGGDGNDEMKGLVPGEHDPSKVGDDAENLEPVRVWNALQAKAGLFEGEYQL